MNIPKQRVVILAVLSITGSLHSMMYLGLEERLRGLTKEEIRTLARNTRQALGMQPKFEMPCYIQSDVAATRVPIIKDSVTIGLDNANNPIVIGYLKAGLPNHDKGTIICCFESYFGREAYRDQLRMWALKGYQAYSFEILSQNPAAAMEGIGGFGAYSFQQDAYLLHQALVALNIPTNEQMPITLTGLDSNGTVALVYAHQYKNDPYSPSYLVLESCDYFAITSDDPCKVPLLSIELAELLSDIYATSTEDRCNILCLLYSGAANQAGNPGNFTEVNCQAFANYILDMSVRYGAAVTPPDILRQRLAIGFQFDP